MRELRIITAQPNDLYFNWQLRVQLHNLRKYGLSDKYTALVWWHTSRQDGNDFKPYWDALKADFPEANIVYYADKTGDLLKLIGMFNYIPLLRPWLLERYFRDNPELKDQAILYMDSDVIFTKKPTFDHLLNDEVCYLSDTKSYISAQYFDSKIKDVLPDMLDNYKKVDILDELMKEFSLSRRTAEENQEGSGGAQYLLKNIDADFWRDVFEGCIKVKMNLGQVNRSFFENEDKGFQSWCADMWSVLFNLWKRGYKTACPPEMDFCWATDPIEKWDKVPFYHDAGAHTREIKPGHQLFLKRESKYINNQGTPFEDDLSFVSNEYCSLNYVKEIREIQSEIDKWTTILIDRREEIKEKAEEHFRSIVKG
jgi:hypothetical protein